jgi:elongation factor G
MRYLRRADGSGEEGEVKGYTTTNIRNVGLFSHVGAGKTTLAESMLYVTGGTSRLGKVLEGTTVSDFDPDEIRRHSSISTSVVPVEHGGCKLNVLDSPGYAEFIGEMLSAMRVVDCAVILVDAHTSIEVGSDEAYHAARRAGVPTMVVLNKMDRENADFDAAVEQMRAAWGSAVRPLYVPIGREQDFRGLAGVLDGRAYLHTAKGEPGFEEADLPEELLPEVSRWRELLIEAAAETDDELTMKYVEGEELTPEEIWTGLRAGVLSGEITPVIPASGGCLVGVSQLLDALVALTPSPLERSARARANGGDELVELSATTEGPPVALIFKTVADPFVGRLSYFRVYSGSVGSDSHLTNPRTGRGERIGQLFLVRGKEQSPAQRLGAGEIGAVAKLAESLTGDTLCGAERTLSLDRIEYPAGSYRAALKPRTKADLDKMGAALHRMEEEDPTLRVSRDAASGETLVTGMGESHIQIMAERMQRKFGVGVDLGLPTVPYRETITVPTTVEYKHKKQTGGHGQYGHVVLRLEPDPEHEFQFASTVVGGAVPKGYFPAVEKGVHDAMQEGIVAGYPIVNVRVTLTDGSHHNVDSSEMAFKLAAAQAFKKGAQDASPALLEPVMEVCIRTPDAFTGDVMSDLNGKRARVEGMEPEGEGTTVIRAQAPLAEMQRYTSGLRAITQGRGSFTMEFSHYEQVPAHLTEAVAAAAKARKDGASH